MNEQQRHPTPDTRHQTPAKLMIRVPNWVGDAVMALPALGELRRIFSEARIVLVANPRVAGLFEGEALADDLITVTEARGPFEVTRQFFHEARRLRRERFDMAVLLPNSFSAAVAARAAGAKQIVGYATDTRRLLLTRAIGFEADFKRRHQVRYYLNIAAQVEQQMTGQSHVDLDAQPALRVGEAGRAHARQILETAGIDPTRRLIALNPGATNSRAKQWPPERFAATADQLNERDDFQTIIVGTAGDREAARAVALQMRSKVADLTGRTSLAELKAVLACAALVISNDTGAAHVAAALHVPTVTIFGPTEDFATRPLADLATVVRHPVECSPCMLRDCPIDHRCMTRVTVADVYQATQNLTDSIQANTRS
ncbi:MAG TPA: lipopolysaccharide heptosyltransferase II [Blastocatellia bacterium]|nr:lipopolysaccharide heptosyltransferase II [Blastocatellia bacterium]